METFHPHLDCPNIGILSNVLILIQAIFGGLAFPQVDAQLDEQEHDRFEGSNGAISGSLGGDMFVQNC